MKITLDWQKRAIIFFAVLVLILSVILTVFAIQEAERDKLAKLEEINREQRQIAVSISDQVIRRIQDSEDQIFNLFSRAINRVGEGQVIDAAAELTDSDELFNLIFYLGRNKQIEFVPFKPLYIVEAQPDFIRYKPLEIESNPLFQKAESAEFQQKNYARAISLYRQLLHSTVQKNSRAFLLNSIARCYAAVGNTSRANQAYQNIVKDFDQVISPEGIPYALIALYQMSSLYFGEGNKLAYIEGNLDLYAALLEPRWDLNHIQFFFYLKKVKENLDALRHSNDLDELEETVSARWQKLEQTEREKQAKMEEIDSITGRVRSSFAMEGSASENPSAKFFRVTYKLEERTVLISYTHPNRDSIVGFSANIPVLEKEVLSSISEHIELKEKFCIQVSDYETNELIAGLAVPNDDSSILQSHTHRFSNDFLPWEIRIYETIPNQAEKQFQLRRNIYILLVLVVISAILLGGVLAIRSTGKELRLAKLKSEFVSTVSHEFRTPLMSIRYLADLLQRGRVKDEGKKQQYYESITHESERLSRLIENILDFSKIEAGMKEYEFSETDLAEMCRDIISRFKDQASPLEFIVESEIAHELPKLPADREALSRAVFNLLDNAVKYSGNSRSIKFRAWGDQKSVYLSVMDKGIGINKEDQDRIFNKFYRSGEIQDSSIKGSGIGLTLVSHIVTAHGGKVDLVSGLGEGTEVTIILPLQAD